ncbi:MAG TPA: hypothetical protein VFC70_02520 [Oscillospiraceae bacterium]|nr:hypothetical protein [Oscillospiraceae bacterium]
MLAESIIRIGEPIRDSKISNKERLKVLTDCDSILFKNFFQHVFLIEIDGDNVGYHFMKVGTGEDDKNFEVDKNRNFAYPIIATKGGDPSLPQGNYPIPCYLVYNSYFNKMNNAEHIAEKFVLPRLERTVSYMACEKENLEEISSIVADTLKNHYEEFIDKRNQKGIICIYDYSLPEFYNSNKRESKKSKYFWLTGSKLRPGEELHLNSDKCIENIVEAKITEAKTLGYEKQAVSTFSNKLEGEVVSIYNKYWPWLSHTWEAPRSIYWGKEDFTRGIKVDLPSYEAYLYGTQFLNRITLPISSSILKEMFAPSMNVEAKRNMKYSSFERIYGVPVVLPLVKDNPEQIYKKYKFILDEHPDKPKGDIHLKLVAGIDSVLPKIEDEYRLTLLYYSGDMTRGNIHIRMVIQDVVPSVAKKLEQIVGDINTKEIFKIQRAFGREKTDRFYSLESLPSMLGNAYGPGYVWSSLETVLNKRPISIDKLHHSTAVKLNELANKTNKKEYGRMINELVFYYGFIDFYNRYNNEILKTGGEINYMVNWAHLLERYHLGEIKMENLKTVEELGYVSGLTLRQFSNSYFHSAGNDFVKHRVMKFGSKLTPEMVWKNGLLQCEELAMQRGMNLADNFRVNLSKILLATLEADEKDLLNKNKDQFMTAFWSGYLMYKKQEGV